MKPFLMAVALIPFLGTPDGRVARPVASPESSIRRELTVDVDLSTRRMVVSVDGKVAGSYEVAVGKPGHRTPTGTYRLSRVVWNPAWNPPKAEWADTATKKEPGEKGNPMGRVKILFEGDLYIHGTTDEESLGEGASHGCLRMSNADAMKLARLVMEYGGASKPPEWYSGVRAKPDESVEVVIPEPPLLRINK